MQKAAFTTVQPFKIKDIKFGKKWVRELRSGRFGQTTGTLEVAQPGNSNPNSCEGSKFCCLGLATRLMVSQHRELLQPSVGYRSMMGNNVIWHDSSGYTDGTFLPLVIGNRLFGNVSSSEIANPYIVLNVNEVIEMVRVWGDVENGEGETFRTHVENTTNYLISLSDRDHVISLSGINDDHFGFDLIADLIDNYLLPKRTRYNKQMIRQIEIVPGMYLDVDHTVVRFVDGKWQCSCGIGTWETFVDYDEAPTV